MENALRNYYLDGTIHRAHHLCGTKSTCVISEKVHPPEMSVQKQQPTFHIKQEIQLTFLNGVDLRSVLELIIVFDQPKNARMSDEKIVFVENN